MTTEVIASLKVGALTALGSLAVEVASPAQVGWVWPVVSGLVGAGAAYGILRATVDALNKQVQDITRDVREIRETTHTTAERVARIEGTMERRGQARERADG
jgi:hypothetical protein